MKAIYILHGLFSLHVLDIYTTQAHGISKRATDDNKLYVLAERSGCVSIDSIEPCPVTWKLSPYAAKSYNQQTKLISVTLKGLELMSASDECKNAMKTTMCGQAAPKCSADDSQDYGNMDTVCPKLYSECPQQISKHFKTQKLCDKVLSGKIKPTCVTPPEIGGNCPQPKYKMPTDALFVYERTSADNGTIESLALLKVSSQCISKVTEMQCTPVYCSEDEKYLLAEFTKADCENTTKHCVTDPIEELIKRVPPLGPQLRPTIEQFEETCDIYPDGFKKEVKTAAPPPTVGTPLPGATVKIIKVGPTGSGNIQLVDCVMLLFSVVVGKLFA